MLLNELAPLSIFDFRQESTFTNSNILFSRKGEASYYGADGLLHFSQLGQNWLMQSQNLTVKPWISVGVSVSTPSSIAAPDGTFSANKITENQVTGEHRMSRNLSVTKGEAVTLSIYVKAGTRSRIQFSFSNGSSYTGGNPTVKFNLATGTFTSISSNVVSSQAVNSGNGWWRIKLTGMPDLGTASGFHLYIVNDSNGINYSGGSDKYIYAWGAQMEAGTNMSTYIPTTVAPLYGSSLRYNYNLSGSTPTLAGALIEPESTNLIPYSQKFDTSAWNKRNSTVVTSGTKSPDGVSSAYKIKENTSSATHNIAPVSNLTTSSGGTYTLSAFLHEAERDWGYFNVNGSSIHFDLNNGTLGNKNSLFISWMIENAGNGWFRCSATFIASSSSTSIYIGAEKYNGQQSYGGDGNSGILVWGVQFEKSIVPTSYIRTNGSAMTRDADIVTLSSPDSNQYDVFIQRSQGGSWINGKSGSYQVETSINEILLINLYNSGVTIREKEESVQAMFPQVYESIGISGTTVPLFNEVYYTQSPSKSWSMQKAVNKTAPIFRAQVNSNDVWSGDANNQDRERSELYLKNANLPFNRDIWLSFAIRIAPGTALNLESADFCYLGQFHASEDDRDISSPPLLGIRLEGLDTIKVFTCSTTDNPHYKSPKSILRGTTQFERGVWHKNVMRIRFSPTNGQLQWWKDGQELVNLSGIGIGYPDEVGPYWKFGIYRSPMSNTIAVEYANMEVDSVNSLLSRINNPLIIS
ncbi:phage head spike fiber domain-containing protein [Dyadobacter sediminis]|uniref:Uncharacterized protein n=1 Tax=Dyadobacter sediminis TaxID=1493691 RepID=A0A5R9KF50_9BACT|nr:heparin lyase I family protein [Dyadobacter sediminis]TLU94790.1 hypothetical protein FEM55_11255 [Dyadobacter sediminis]GGB88123.1 hypothetical protein GCM10011325_14580 [Dyadobacter sediminis]